ncbi:hypothetical protein FGG79_20780 [Bacillus sp. BHET2]|uniref:hypothetical protein n=1 Tax=Bacillus sp. BHET2 TaxID=2583818 RepID=UPI00110DF358|nr:hypothetical protein [Bacillus sp. BHET2]TMU82719.1 hypothetical protein FGG79_20780 [Bacillus sp. BHET2]
MKKYIGNEKGNSIFFILWLFGIVAIVFLLVANIAKIYVVQAQANSSVEQAAFAGTSVLIEETTRTIEEFDGSGISAAQKFLDGGKSIKEQIEEKQQELEDSGRTSDLAYLHALNDVLPGELEEHPLLKEAFSEHFSRDPSLNSRIRNTAQSILTDNNANPEDMDITLSTEEWRIEVKSTATFESIADKKLIEVFQEKVPQKGYGPKLKYLEKVYE